MPTRGNVGAFATVAAGKVTDDKCKLDPGDSGGEKPQLVKMGSLSFYKSEEVWGGTESATTIEHYETFNEGVCYDVTLGLPQPRYHRKGMTDQALFNRLYVVLRTFYFAK